MKQSSPSKSKSPFIHTEIHNPGLDVTTSYPFLSTIPWSGGMALAQNPREPLSQRLFQNLVCHPTKLALRSLDRTLRDVLASLPPHLKQRRSKPQSNRGREIVRHWLKSLADLSPRCCFEHSSVFELGFAMLEVVNQISEAEAGDNRQEGQYIQYTVQHMIDRMMLDFISSIQQDMHPTYVFTQLMFIFALAGQEEFDAYTTMPMCRDAMVGYWMSNLTEDRIEALGNISKSLQRELLALVVQTEESSPDQEEDWEWTDEAGTSSQVTYDHVQVKLALEDEFDILLRHFKVRIYPWIIIIPSYKLIIQ